MKNITKQIQAANENSINLLLGKFHFDPRKSLNKTLIFDDKYWIEHKPGTNYLH